jgi:hypothetical protein
LASGCRSEKTPYCGHPVKYLESWGQDDVIKNQDVVIRKVGFEVACYEESGVFWGSWDTILQMRTIDAWQRRLEVFIIEVTPNSVSLIFEA